MFVYSITPATNETTDATLDTLDAYLAIRETSQAVWLQTWLLQGKGAALTALTGIMHRLRHWTTVGTAGSSIVPQPVRSTMPVAQTLAVNGAYTEGTVSGATVLAIGHGAAGPGGWMARDAGSAKVLEAGSVDEWSWNSIQSGSIALNFEVYGEIYE